MKQKRLVRREIAIARACFAQGLDYAVEDYEAAVLDMLVGRPPEREQKNRQWFRERFDGFFARYGARSRRGAKPEPIDAKKVLSYVKAHREFILDAHARPEDMAEYVKECQDGDAAPATEAAASEAKAPKQTASSRQTKSQPALAGG